MFKCLHRVDKDGNVILDEKHGLPSWIDCKSCKFTTDEVLNWPQYCPERKKAITENDDYSISVSWGEDMMFGWFCLLHEFKKHEF